MTSRPPGPRPSGPRPFGKYLLDREIARGGMARVHLARLRGLGGFEKRLVLKEIDPALASDPRFIALFVEEANTLVQMSHPNIVPVYELGVVDGTYFLAMEHVHGTTLEALVRNVPLDPEEAAHIGAQVADALGYAHERFGLVHRDVTPRNVMIDAHGHARLLDFGIAARLDDGESQAAVFGTPGYLSPEQARGERLTAKSDLFALGAVLYRAVTARHAIEATVEASRALSGSLDLPLLERLPAELARTIHAALSVDPADRPASGKAMAAQLRAFLAARRPEGIGGALGARAVELAEASAATSLLAEPAEVEVPTSDGRARSLATSPVLEAMLGTPPRAAGPPPRKADSVSPTAPIEETPSRGTASPETDEAGPRTQPIVGRSTRPPEPSDDGAWLKVGLLTLVLGGLAMWALSFARFEAPTREVEPRPLDPTPLEIDPPDADLDSPDLSADAGVLDETASLFDASGIATEAPDAGARRVPDAVSSRPTSAGSGTITVQALPWADVEIDGAAVGRTPLRARAIAVGHHRLVLRCPPLGREVRDDLEIEQGEGIRVTADLQTSPPTITVRD